MKNVTRELGWNVPTILHVLMYIGFVVSLAILIYGIIKKIKVYKKGKAKRSATLGNFIRFFFQDVLWHKKIRRELFGGLFHSFIFFGFVALMITTALVGVDMDVPGVDFFHGWFYLIVSLLADIAGVLILVGLIIAGVRRYILKPERIKTSHKKDLVMHLIIWGLIITGFLVEGIRMAVKPAPYEYYTIFSPVGYMVSLLFKPMVATSLDSLMDIHRTIWAIHMFGTMIFIALIPFTKFNHFILGIISLGTQKTGPSGVLEAIPFEEMEDAESFGYYKVDEFSWRDRLSFDTCMECGRCEVNCPAHLTHKVLNPKNVIVKLRDQMWEDETKEEAESVFENEKIEYEELFSCTTCGACQYQCPVGIEHVNILLDLRRFLALTEGKLPEKAADALKNIEVNQNPWGISFADRFNWAEGIENLKVLNEGDEAEYLYFVGCAGAFDPLNQEVTKAMVRLLQKAGVDFGVLGKREPCCGDIARRLGDEYRFSELAANAVEILNSVKFKKIIVHCPHGLHTIANEYKAFGGDYEVIHHTQLLRDLLKEGKLKPSTKVEMELSFHDPCYLGRHNGETKAPREILNAVDGVTLTEPKMTKEKSFCCGMGGGNMWFEFDRGEVMTNVRLDQIMETKKETIVTACPYCLINMEFGTKTDDKYKDMKVIDVSQILDKSID